MADPATTSLRKCKPRMMRENATLKAQKISPYISVGSNRPIETAKAKALIECPEGKEN
jgi:hypothetical protein